MSNFDKALALVLKNEGGYTDDPADSGGATNWGITIGRYSEFLGRPASKKEVREMPIEDAKKIYKKSYWDVLRLDEVVHEKLATILFDQGVNRGTGTAAKSIQSILGLNADGKIGPMSLKAINTCDEIKTSLKFIQAAQKAYVRIVKSRSSQIVFLEGWLNRTHGLLDYLIDA